MLGIIVYQTKTGLGYQTADYYKFLKPDKIMVVDLSPLNGIQQQSWYEREPVKGIPNREQIANFLQGLDTILVAETPLNYDLFKIAKARGIRTINVENPEFFDYFKYPELPLPDIIILPSTWLENEIRSYAEPRGTKVFQIHHPVDRDTFKFRQREQGKTFHIAGKPAAYDRNGTWDYLAAFPDGTVLTQSSELASQIRTRYRHSKVVENVDDPVQMYHYGDILVLPRRYGGNCLPLNEALSSGCPVVMPDISPNEWLPEHWRVNARKINEFQPRGKVDIFGVSIDDMIDKVANIKANIREESQKASELADMISWDNLKEKYESIISRAS